MYASTGQLPVGHVAEPMTLGSPSSPATHPHGQSQFLPSYLLGEASFSSSPQGRHSHWSSPSGNSPPKSSLNKSSSFMSPTSPYKDTSAAFGHTSRSEARNREMSMMGHRPKDKVGAPPVQGLLEHITSPASAAPSPYTATPERRQLDFNRGPSHGAPASATPSQSRLDASASGHGLFSPSSSQTSQLFSPQHKTPPSPAQVDPFYTQGEAISADDTLDETWVTIFGFPPAATSYILQQFSQYGNILKHVVATDGNWMHLHYQSKLQAKKALSKNGKVFGGGIMVGVAPCIDKSIMAGDKETSSPVRRTTTIGTPTQQLQHETSLQRHNPIRPLTAAYQAARSEHEVVQNSCTPKKTNGVVSKVMEYMFNW